MLKKQVIYAKNVSDCYDEWLISEVKIIKGTAKEMHI